MEMSKYVKKPIVKEPIVIEAVRFMLEDTLPDWFMDKVTDYTITTYASGACDIKTLRGTVRADFGDYIIMDKNGEVYPCKPEIFNKNYRKIEEGGDIKFEIDNKTTDWERAILIPDNFKKAVDNFTNITKNVTEYVIHQNTDAYTVQSDGKKIFNKTYRKIEEGVDMKFEIDNKAIDWGRKEIITYKVYIKHDKHKNCNLDVLLEDLENIISGLSKIVAAIKDTGYNAKYYVNEEENICTHTFVMERMI